MEQAATLQRTTRVETEVREVVQDMLVAKLGALEIKEVMAELEATTHLLIQVRAVVERRQRVAMPLETLVVLAAQETPTLLLVQYREKM